MLEKLKRRGTIARKLNSTLNTVSMLITIHTFTSPTPIRHETAPHFRSRALLRLSTRYLKAGFRHCLPFRYVHSLVSKHNIQVLNAFYALKTVTVRVTEEAATQMHLPLTMNSNGLKPVNELYTIVQFLRRHLNFEEVFDWKLEIFALSRLQLCW